MKNEQTEITDETAENGEGGIAPRAKNAWLALAMSAVIPGLGQVYAGHWLWGIIWFSIWMGIWIGTAGTLNLIFHVLAAIQAYRQAIARNRIY